MHTANQLGEASPRQDHCNGGGGWGVRELLFCVPFPSSLTENSFTILITDYKMGQRGVIQHGQSHIAIIYRGQPAVNRSRNTGQRG